MSLLHFHCGSCSQQISTPAKFTGRKTKCKHCGAVYIVPAPGEIRSQIIGYAAAPPPLDAPAAAEKSAKSTKMLRQAALRLGVVTCTAIAFHVSEFIFFSSVGYAHSPKDISKIALTCAAVLAGAFCVLWFANRFVKIPIASFGISIALIALCGTVGDEIYAREKQARQDALNTRERIDEILRGHASETPANPIPLPDPGLPRKVKLAEPAILIPPTLPEGSFARFNSGAFVPRPPGTWLFKAESDGFTLAIPDGFVQTAPEIIEEKKKSSYAPGSLVFKAHDFEFTRTATSDQPAGPTISIRTIPYSAIGFARQITHAEVPEFITSLMKVKTADASRDMHASEELKAVTATMKNNRDGMIWDDTRCRFYRSTLVDSADGEIAVDSMNYLGHEVLISITFMGSAKDAPTWREIKELVMDSLDFAPGKEFKK